MILTGMRARPLSDVSLEISKVSKELDTFPFKAKQILPAILRWEVHSEKIRILSVLGRFFGMG